MYIFIMHIHLYYTYMKLNTKFLYIKETKDATQPRNHHLIIFENSNIHSMFIFFANICTKCFLTIETFFFFLAAQLHSEYRSTYRWHEYTGGSRPEVIRRPPIANQFGKLSLLYYTNKPFLKPFNM